LLSKPKFHLLHYITTRHARRVILVAHVVTCVKSAPSSERENGAPLTAISAVGRCAIVPVPPTSQRSNVSYPRWSELPERRDGPPWGGLTAPPALSLRAKRIKALAPPPCMGKARGGNSPPPDVVIVADEGTPTSDSRATDEFSCSLTLPRPKDVARGFRFGPAYPKSGLKLHSQADT